MGLTLTSWSSAILFWNSCFATSSAFTSTTGGFFSKTCKGTSGNGHDSSCLTSSSSWAPPSLQCCTWTSPRWTPFWGTSTTSTCAPPFEESGAPPFEGSEAWTSYFSSTFLGRPGPRITSSTSLNGSGSRVTSGSKASRSGKPSGRGFGFQPSTNAPISANHGTLTVATMKYLAFALPWSGARSKGPAKSTLIS